MPATRRRAPLALAAALLLAGPAAAQQQDTTPLRVVRVAEGVHLLMGRGGNIGVSSGEDGVFLVDDQYAPMTEQVRRAVASVTPRAIRFVLNTHWHGDHTGGNEALGRTGVLIVAHDNVRVRMSTEQFIELLGARVPASAREALPVVTFADAVTFHLNGDEIHAFHVPPAHTDGDAIVHWRRANVVHMGDVYFNGSYPFVDHSSGGSVDGIIGAADRVLAMSNDSTRIIPGHGPLATRADLQAYRDMVATARDRVRAAVAAGRTLEQAKAADLLADLNARWGGGFIRPDVFVQILYQDLSRTGR
ncbi:MAG TPA: MBL fold metallo-hydrolase [Longimicrobiaceae bacterium]|nr:MBL fold metallo-hydrolase [Longimicrobiaceae bacterium]